MSKIFKLIYPGIIAFIITLILLKYVFFIGIIPSGSMEPTIKAESLVIGIRASNVKRGDVVIFKNNEYLIKRVIGVGGDKVTLGKGVYVNGEKLKEEYLEKEYIYEDKTYIVPKGMLFLLGDNRMNSYDSRYWEDPFIGEDRVITDKFITLRKLF